MAETNRMTIGSRLWRAVLRRGVRMCRLATVGALLLPELSAAPPPVAQEYEVKAGYLVAFARYITWPGNTFAPTNSTIVIGVLGSDPFGEVLDRIAHAEKGTRPLQVRRISTVDEAAQCHMVFIPKAENRNENTWLEALRDKPVLTVGESGHTLDRGGVLELFVVADNHVRYEASWRAMERAGLKLSADLLASARKVRERPSAKP